MSASRWEQVKDIFQAALERPLPEREQFLSDACGGDTDLCDEIRDLLLSFESAGSFMDEEAIGEVAEIIVGQPQNINISQKLGRYLITDRLGAGGMGEVFLAKDMRLERLVALKILSAEFSRNGDRIRRFVQEAKAVSALNHPNILTIYEIGQFDALHFIVTEFIKGDTLRQRLKDERMTLREILDIAVQTAAALAAAHEAGIIHRDIKPENVMLRVDGLVKVLDFGLSKLIEEKRKTVDSKEAFSAQVQTTPGMVMGTVAYMSPEQARGLQVDAQTDVWSLGVVLYEMLTRKQPFTGETKSDTIASILTNEPVPLAENAPAELNRIVGKALQKKAGERYQTIKDFLLDLQQLRKRIEFELEQNSSRVAPAGWNLNSKAAKIAEDSIVGETELPPNNLTENLSLLIGREKETAKITTLLRKAGTRLLTLTGVGGTGKTRLARAIAREMLPEFPDGVFFVELAAITNSELVAATIASPLGIKEVGGKPIFEVLKDYLHERVMLIVIDNFEQVVNAAPQIAELLSAASQLKILITSRMTLNLSAEREFVVAPLTVPSKAALDSLNELATYSAIELFVDRAQIVKPKFALTKENARSVGAICARLDGLPLAIELAAARIKILSPQIILTKLENRLKLLTSGARDLPARQQTMRDTIAWSYNLLTEDEKRLFRQLAVFAGGFTFEAAENVSICSELFDKDANGCENEQLLADPSPLFTVLDGITSLVDKSLLVSKEQANGDVRFRMLEVVRDFALEALTASGEEEKLRRNHAEYFLTVGEEAEPHLQAVQSAEWLDRLEEEHDNLRAALRWSFERDAGMAVRLAAAIRRFWILHNYFTEGRGWLEEALERSNNVSPAVRFKLLNILGLLARLQGDLMTALKIHEEGLAVGRAANNLRQIAISSNSLGLVMYQLGNLSMARKLYNESLEINRDINDKFRFAVSLNFLGNLTYVEGNDRAANQLFEESLAICKQMGNKQAVSCNLANLGAIAHERGDNRAARVHFGEALMIAQELDYQIVISSSLDGFAALALNCGDAERAACLAGAAEHLRESIGYEIEPAERRFRDVYLTELRATLSKADFAVAYEQGSKLKLEEAIAITLA